MNTQLLAVLDASDAVVARFEHAGGRMPVARMQGGALYYLAYDQVGSLRAVYTAAGAVVRTVEYDAWGVILDEDIAQGYEGLNVPFGFAGGLNDRDTGLVLFGLRNYDPETGRWTSRDPISLAGGDTDLYAYCGNDPVGKTDPTGLEEVLNGWRFIDYYYGRMMINESFYHGQPNNHAAWHGFNPEHVIFDVLSDPTIDVGQTSSNVYMVDGMRMSSGQMGNFAAGYVCNTLYTPILTPSLMYLAEFATNKQLGYFFDALKGFDLWSPVKSISSAIEAANWGVAASDAAESLAYNLLGSFYSIHDFFYDYSRWSEQHPRQLTGVET